MSQYSRWPTSVKVSVLVAGIIAAFAVVGVVDLLEDDTPEVAVPQSQEQEVAERPKCPEGPIAGVDLPCLGASSSAAAKDIQIVTVWAWWCEPCRTELPVLERYAADHPDVEVVGVHADRQAAAGADLLNELGVELSSYQDSDNSFAGQLGLPGVVPITVVFRDGEQVGTLAQAFESEEALASAIDGVLRR